MSPSNTTKVHLPLWWRFRKLFGPVVALLDYDGEVAYRPATNTPFGFRCCRFEFGIRPLELHSDGRVTSGGFKCYVKSWKLV